MPAVPPRALREFVDQRLNGELDTRLRAWLAADYTLAQMVDALSEAGVEVSRETVRRWLLELKAKPAA